MLFFGRGTACDPGRFLRVKPCEGGEWAHGEWHSAARGIDTTTTTGMVLVLKLKWKDWPKDVLQSPDGGKTFTVG